MTTMNEARVGFEAWLGITPKGAAHDLAYEAFKAGAAWQRAQGAVPEAKVTGAWESARIGDFNAGWNACRDSVFTLMKKAAYMELDTTKRSIAIQDELRDQLAAAPAQPAVQGEFGDAYQGAREDLAIWKRRALEAEAKVRHQDQIIDHLTLEAQGESRMGEPDIPAAHDQSEVQRLREALDHIGGLSRALRVGGPDPMDLEGLSNALEEAVDTAHAALAPSTGQEVGK